MSQFVAILYFALALLIFACLFLCRRADSIKNENEHISNLYNELKKDLDKQTTERFEFEENQFLDKATVLKNERERFARELHDDLMQRLVAIRFRLEQLTYYSLKLEVEQEINRLRDELDGTMRD